MIRTQKLFIPERFPGLNELIGENRKHWSKGAQMKQDFTMISKVAAKRNLKPVTRPVMIGWKWYEPASSKNTRDRDPDNITSAKKFILDGMVAAGIIPDDNQKWIKGWLYEEWSQVKDNIRVGVLVEIQEVEDDTNADI